MVEILHDNYKCSICGEIHKTWPALAFNSPISYHELSKELKNSIAKIDSDFCIINYPDQTYRFIRVILKQKVNNFNQHLEYGLWVSISGKSFSNYSENYKKDNYEEKYFGWLNSCIPEYENTMNIPTTVTTGKGNERPEIIPHEDHTHKFVEDYYNGITKEEAEKRIHEMMKNAR